MADEAMHGSKELTLFKNEFAMTQDVAKGSMKVFVGPTTLNQTAQEIPVVYERGSFRRCTHLEEARTKWPFAPEGFYVVLFNPPKNGEQPAPGTIVQDADLIFGQKINIPGPWHNALWPGQSAEVRRGHQLRLNQYLIVKVYNEDQARQNWGKGVVKPVEGSDDVPVVTSEIPDDLTVGQKYIIKGTDVSFYIPPTGISVIHVEGNKQKYVRDAMTLERLEYCILVDEDGNKRYERGPNVVFPEPTEDFIADKSGRKKFKAIELNEIQGIHVKVIADYTDDAGEEHKEGDELFIKGDTTAIYYPREEHSHIKYDGKAKHFATAIPKGEGRYVMDRLTGDINLIHGPAMLLPDPRKQVIVKRALDEKHVRMWYPGNQEAIEFNRDLRELATNAPTTRSGAVSDGDYERMSSQKSRKQRKLSSHEVAMEASQSNRQQSVAGDEFSRASSYTQPRTVMLGKYDGVPRIDVWTGYAVQVVGPDKRRVEVGPTTLLLEYDEVLEIITLSTGKPKNTDNLKRTPYLRVSNNYVTDVIEGVETREHVQTNIKLIYKVDFEDDPNNWFDIENYVKHLCDHCRSVIKGAAKHIGIERLYGDPVGFIRDLILGEKAEGEERPGMSFPNGMRIKDIEIQWTKIMDENIRRLLLDSQQSAVTNHITLLNAKSTLDMEAELHVMEREKTRMHLETQMDKMKKEAEISQKRDDLKGESIERATELQKAQAEGTQELEMAAKEHSNSLTDLKIKENNAIHDCEQRINAEEAELRIKELVANTEAVVKRAQAVSPELQEALRQFIDTTHLSSMIKELGPHAALQGESLMGFTKRFFDQMPDKFQALLQVGNGQNGS